MHQSCPSPAGYGISFALHLGNSGPEPARAVNKADTDEESMTPDVNSSWKGDKPEGKYANYFKVGHNAVEFVIDFGQYYSENDQAELYSRIITNPIYAKELLAILQEAIEQYEQSFGDIRNEIQQIQIS